MVILLNQLKTSLFDWFQVRHMIGYRTSKKVPVGLV